MIKIVGLQRRNVSTVTLERGLRGGISVGVVLHQGSEPGLESIAATAAAAQVLFDELCARYPVADGADGGDGK